MRSHNHQVSLLILLAYELSGGLEIFGFRGTGDNDLVNNDLNKRGYRHKKPERGTWYSSYYSP